MTRPEAVLSRLVVQLAVAALFLSLVALASLDRQM